jgi:hexosaminidase
MPGHLLLEFPWGPLGQFQEKHPQCRRSRPGSRSRRSSARRLGRQRALAAASRFLPRLAAGRLGDLFDAGDVRLHNAGILAMLLLPDLQRYYGEELKRLRGYDFSLESGQIEKASTLLQQAEIRGPEAEIVQAELRFTADLMAHAARLGRERFATRGLHVDEIPASSRREMAAELESLITRYRELWLKRSRPGGLEDSIGRMLVLNNSYLSK